MGKKTGMSTTMLDATLDSIERAFKARVLIYATGNRQPQMLFGATVANDVLPLFGEHLESVKRAKRLALVLHTNGGTLDTPWPIVNLLRGHCKELLVLVPEIALSAGTLIALGAHKIYMHPHAFLSPVDPTGNWKDTAGKTQSLAIEDVMGYVDFVSDRVGIRDQAALVEALKELTKEVTAPRLGSVHRTRLLIERLSRNMLELHLNKIDDQPRITQIVDMLTHSLFTHEHMIAVGEAQKAIGLGEMVVEVKGQEEQAMNRAKKYINDTLQLRAPFDPEALLAKCPKPRSKPAAAEPNAEAPLAKGQKPLGKPAAAEPDAQVKIEARRAIIHSRHARHTCKSAYSITKGTDGQVQVKPVGVTAWIREN